MQQLSGCDLGADRAHSSRLALRSGDEPPSNEEEVEEESRSYDEDFGEGSDDAEDKATYDVSASEGDGNTSLSRANSPAGLPELHPVLPLTAPLATQLSLEQHPRPTTPPIPNSGSENVEGAVVDDTENAFLLEGCQTRVGRKRKARNVNAMLSVCICGKTFSQEGKNAQDLAIECKRAWAV